MLGVSTWKTYRQHDASWLTPLHACWCHHHWINCYLSDVELKIFKRKTPNLVERADRKCESVVSQPLPLTLPLLPPPTTTNQREPWPWSKHKRNREDKTCLQPTISVPNVHQSKITRAMWDTVIFLRETRVFNTCANSMLLPWGSSSVLILTCITFLLMTYCFVKVDFQSLIW